MQTTTKDKLTRKDLAAIFGVTVRTIASWRTKGILPPAKRIGGRLFWSPQQVEKMWEEEGKSGKQI